MKAAAVEKLKAMVTPKVTLENCHDIPDGIKADIRYEYQYPERAFGTPITWAKTFTVLADKEGNVYSAVGLF